MRCEWESWAQRSEYRLHRRSAGSRRAQDLVRNDGEQRWGDVGAEAGIRDGFVIVLEVEVVVVAGEEGRKSRNRNETVTVTET